LDDTQRVIVATFGGGFILGAIAWVSVASVPGSVTLPLRIVPPLAMVVVGALLGAWGWPRGKGVGPVIPTHDAQRAITEARQLAEDLLSLRDDYRWDRQIGGPGSDTVAFQLENGWMDTTLYARATQLFNAGRAWGFFQPDETNPFQPPSHTKVLKDYADRLEGFASYLEERQRT
jgi:hypothetical protein